MYKDNSTVEANIVMLHDAIKSYEQCDPFFAMSATLCRSRGKENHEIYLLWE